MDIDKLCVRPARSAAVIQLALVALAGGAPDGKAQIMEEVTVTASPLGAADTATQGSVTPQDLEEFPTYRAGELLETVPGLIVTQHSGEGKANQYFLRGFNLDHGTDIDISVDDMPVNLRTHAHGQGYSDLNFMIPELVSGIDYSKGPYFADKGDFDTAGAVSIGYVDTLPHDLASVSAGTLGDYRGFAAASRPWGGGNLLLASEYDHADGPWQIPDNFNKGNLVLRYSRGTAENGFSLTGMFMDDAWHATNQIPERAVTEGLIDLYGPLDPTDGGSSERYSLSGKYADTDDARQVKANAYYIGDALQLFNDFDGYVTFPPPVGDQFEQQERRRIIGGATSYTRFGQLFGRESDNTVGFETRTDFVHMGLDETTDAMPALRPCATIASSRRAAGSMPRIVPNGSTNSAPSPACARTFTTARTAAPRSPPIRERPPRACSARRSNAIAGPWQKTEFYLSYGARLSQQRSARRALDGRCARDRAQPDEQDTRDRAAGQDAVPHQGGRLRNRHTQRDRAAGERRGRALRPEPRERGNLRRRRRR